MSPPGRFKKALKHIEGFNRHMPMVIENGSSVAHFCAEGLETDDDEPMTIPPPMVHMDDDMDVNEFGSTKSTEEDYEISDRGEEDDDEEEEELFAVLSSEGEPLTERAPAKSRSRSEKHTAGEPRTVEELPVERATAKSKPQGSAEKSARQRNRLQKAHPQQAGPRGPAEKS